MIGNCGMEFRGMIGNCGIEFRENVWEFPKAF
jgi:hypothetical protein